MNIIVASSGIALAGIYNTLKATTGEDYETLMISSTIAGLVTPMAEKLMQHFKSDNLEKEAKAYRRGLGFFQAQQQPAQPEANIGQEEPENVPGEQPIP